MSTFHKILFPVDLSDSGRNAAPFIDAMMKQFQAEVTLLHVIETGQSYLSVEDLQLIRNSRINELDQFLPGVFSGPMVCRDVIEGEPAEAITRFAQAHKFDLVAMPTHGVGRFREWLVGSVTAKVLHDCPLPVWTGVHTPSATDAVPAFTDIVCAVDLQCKSVPMIEFAGRIASQCESRLWLVHAIPGSEARPEKYFDTDLIAYLEKEARRTLTDHLKALNLKAGICLGVGDVDKVVRCSALEHKAAIVIAGRGHATQTLGRIRAHVYSIIRESPCPVISV